MSQNIKKLALRRNRMNTVFLGGGSLRILPIIRSIFALVPDYFRNGEIRLVDLKIERAEAVGKLIQACPEYNNVGCKVIWTDDLDSALPGTDVLYLTMAARRDPSDTQCMHLGNKFNYCCSDNLSICGAFLSLRLGRTIFNIAKKMERLCPDALMLIFPNPVAVYSHLVNTHTKVRALGICGGFSNHRWDLTRLTGRNEYDPSWNVIAAGINHMSFILRGTKNGKDLYGEILPEYLTDDWKPLEISAQLQWVKDGFRLGQLSLYRCYKRYGKTIFSTEGDGVAHIFPDLFMEHSIKRFGMGEDFDPEAVDRQTRQREKERFDSFIRSACTPEKIDWTEPAGFYGRCDSDIMIPLSKALCGVEPMRIVATRPNMGAVRGFSSDTPLEYTMDIYKKDITPVEDQYIPDPFTGLVATLADFQRLQSEAIAAWDPEIFANALDAYPVHRFTERRKEYFRGMFRIFEDLDPHILKAEQYFM